MQVIETLGIDHVDLTVNDLERSAHFYEKVLTALGFRRMEAQQSLVWANGHVSFAFRPAAAGRGGAPFNRYRVGLHHLALKAKSREDVDRFHAFLLREGLTVLDPPAAYPQYGAGYYAVFFADPDGIKLELVHFPGGAA